MQDTDTSNIRDAARRLVNGFSAISGAWAALAAEHLDNREFFPLPMWGTLFKVDNPCDARKIRELLVPIGPDACKTLEDLMSFMEDEGFDAPSALATLSLAAEDVDEDDIDALRDYVRDQWEGLDCEDAYFAAGGWQAVGSTGILAHEVDGFLLLGINGAGYGFYESHWEPLYQALGYKWHE